MSSPYDTALTELYAQRELISDAIEVLERVRDHTTIRPSVPVDVPERRKEPRTQSTDRRATPSPQTSRSVTAHGDAILTALKNAGGSMTPGELSAAFDIGPAALRARTAPLVATGQLLVTGVTAARRYALPEHQAKEAP